MAIINILCGNLFLPQGFAFGVYEDGVLIAAPVNTITFTDSASVVTDYKTASNVFGVSHDVVASLVISRSVSNHLGILQDAARPIFISVTDYLQMSQEARTVLHVLVGNTLSLSQSLDFTRGPHNAIVLSQAVVVQVVKRQTITHTLSLTQGVSVYKQNDPSFSPSVPAPSFQPVVLAYSPYSITLVVPELGDEDRIEHQRINRKNRGGETIIYHDPEWPVIEVLNFEFQNLTQTQVKTLLDFVQVTLGRTITLTDHNNVGWEGIIINPDFEATCVRERGCGGFTVPLQFEGVRV